jgi:hypothetical protein
MSLSFAQAASSAGAGDSGDMDARRDDEEWPLRESGARTVRSYDKERST